VVRGGLVMGCPLVAPVACMLCLLSMVQWGHGAGTAVYRDCGHTWRIVGTATSSHSGAVEDAVWSVVGW
jgi:hypothetical protein